MKVLFTAISLLIILGAVHGQKRYFTRTGQVSFEASTPLEKITPVNKTASSVLDAGTGQIEFAVLIRAFEFDKALMQEHFNENYMESDKFPRSVFKGRIVNMQSLNLQVDGSYPATVKGIIEIHGVKKEITASGTILVSRNTLKVTSAFNVTISDFNISIPGIVRDKISRVAKVTVSCLYAPLNPK